MPLSKEALEKKKEEAKRAFLEEQRQKLEKKYGKKADRTNREKKWANSFIEEGESKIKAVKPKVEKVPVHVDSKTIIYVRKDKCRKLPNGMWTRK